MRWIVRAGRRNDRRRGPAPRGRRRARPGRRARLRRPAAREARRRARRRGRRSRRGRSRQSPARTAERGEVRILLRTDDLVAVDKPAGIPTIADHGGAAHALVALTARALGVDAVELAPDVAARSRRERRGRLRARRRRRATARRAPAPRGAYVRRYVAIAVARARRRRAGTWDAPIGRAADPRHRAVRRPRRRRRQSRAT